MKQIAIFGGSFDPMHMGHVKLARYLKTALSLDKLIVVPAAVSPFKTGTYSTDADRIRICRLSLPGRGFTVSDYEIKKGGVSYSIDTVEFFRAKYPAHRLWFVIGEDQLFQFHLWYRYRDILKTVSLVAVRRNNATAAEQMEAYADAQLRPWGKCVILPFEPLEVSSTELRERLRQGEAPADLIAPAALDYIKERGLYRD